MTWRGKTLLGFYMLLCGWTFSLYVTDHAHPKVTLEPSCKDGIAAFMQDNPLCTKLDYTDKEGFVARCKKGDYLLGNMRSDNMGVRAVSFMGVTKHVSGECDCARTPACLYK